MVIKFKKEKVYEDLRQQWQVKRRKKIWGNADVSMLEPIMAEQLTMFLGCFEDVTMRVPTVAEQSTIRFLNAYLKFLSFFF